MTPTTCYPHVETILHQYKNVIKSDYQGYYNHVTRMLNFCHYLLPNASDEESQKLQIAAAFHDIALWTHDRVDYLEPSYQECQQYLEREGLTHWKKEIQIIIDMHHLIGNYEGPYQHLVEVFRKADLVDFSLGILRNGISKEFVIAVKDALPNAGFHKTLMRFTLKQLKRNPFKPAPMLRLKNVYKSE